MKVLIAESSLIVRERIASLVKEIEAVDFVGQANTASKALDLFQQQKPDVVLLSLHLSGGDGFCALRSLKKRENPPLVIVISDNMSSVYKRRCKEAGADFFFDEAADYEEMMETLARFGT